MTNFVADRMLGKLAKWLRILGFDTLYPGEIPDAQIKALAERENRILLTRDRQLHESCPSSILIESDEPDAQIRQVVGKFAVEREMILTRCILCNEPVVEISKDAVAGKVPEEVLERQEKFWICKNCDRIYWSASHWDNMLSKLSGLI